MRAEYYPMCVRFRRDDPAHTEAWRYLKEHSSRKMSCADVIAVLVAEKEGSGDAAPASDERVLGAIEDVKSLCRTAVDMLGRGVLPAEMSMGTDTDMLRQEDHREEENGIADFAMDMGD